MTRNLTRLQIIVRPGVLASCLAFPLLLSGCDDSPNGWGKSAPARQGAVRAVLKEETVTWTYRPFEGNKQETVTLSASRIVERRLAGKPFGSDLFFGKVYDKYPKILDDLIQMLKDTRDDKERKALIEELQEQAVSSKHFKKLIPFLKSDDEDLRWAAVQILDDQLDAPEVFSIVKGHDGKNHRTNDSRGEEALPTPLVLKVLKSANEMPDLEGINLADTCIKLLRPRNIDPKIITTHRAAALRKFGPTGNEYWKSIKEMSASDEGRKALHDEFENRFSEIVAEISRAAKSGRDEIISRDDFIAILSEQPFSADAIHKVIAEAATEWDDVRIEDYTPEKEWREDYSRAEKKLAERVEVIIAVLAKQPGTSSAVLPDLLQARNYFLHDGRTKIVEQISALSPQSATDPALWLEDLALVLHPDVDQIRLNAIHHLELLGKDAAPALPALEETARYGGPWIAEPARVAIKNIQGQL